ncbi:MAG: uroporphyrinogen decarboxylase family protein [Planctomycetota bacterium]
MRKALRSLLARQVVAGEAGRQGGYIFAPAHAVEGDVPLENMLAFIEVAKNQVGSD